MATAAALHPPQQATLLLLVVMARQHVLALALAVRVGLKAAGLMR